MVKVIFYSMLALSVVVGAIAFADVPQIAQTPTTLPVTPLTIKAYVPPPPVGLTSTPQACSPLLQQLQTKHSRFGSLCSLAQRYQIALAKLRAEGVKNPERMADLMAPRLIDMPDWVKSDIRVKFDPVNFYQPAPTTRITWEKGLHYLDQQKANNEASGTIAQIDLDWVRELHKTTMTGVMDAGEVPGAFRTGQEVGRIVQLKDAVNAVQAHEMANGGGYKSLLDPTKPLFLWQTKKCFNEIDPATQASIRAGGFKVNPWPDAPATEFIKGYDGQMRQCGYAWYTDIKEVPMQLQAWIDYINLTSYQLMTHSMQQDPVEFLARVQRWFIAIHPFSDGNGRMSRFMLELMTGSMGLPPPILAEMNDDITTPEPQWADQVVEGMWRTVRITEICAATPSKGGCNVLPQVVQ